MAFPTVITEIDVTNDPGSAVTTWTDISAYVKACGPKRGRQRERQQFQALSGELVLDNTDRRFDPENTAGPYYPNVVPMRRIRQRATFNAVTYAVWYGYAEDFRPQYGYPAENTVRVPITDAFVVFANAALPGSLLEYEIKADDPIGWWRLGDMRDAAVAADSSGNGHHADYIGGPQLGSSSLLQYSGSTGATFDGVDDYVSQPDLSAALTVPFTIEAWIATTTAGTALIFNQFGEAGSYVRFGVNASGNLFFLTTLVTASSSPVVVNDGALHHVAVTVTTTDTRLYVDGVDVTAGSPAGMASVDASAQAFFAATDGSQPLPGTGQDVATYATALSPARIAAHYAAAAPTPTGAWGGLATGTVVDNILDLIGWPVAARSIDAGNSTVQPLQLGGKALGLLQAITTTEQGAFYVLADGSVRFRERLDAVTPPATTSVATFSDGAAGLRYSDIDPDHAVDLIRNHARIGRKDGTVQEWSDATSEARFLTRTEEQTDLLYADDNQALAAAQWIVDHYKDPLLRYGKLVIEPYGDETNLFPQMLGRDIGDRITIVQTPPGGAVAISIDMVIEGVEHEASDLHWRTTWMLSPADTRSYWVLGDATYGVLGSTTRLAF